MKLAILAVILCAFISGVKSGYSKANVETVYKWKKVVYENLPKSGGKKNSFVGPYPYYIAENNDIECMAYHPGRGLMIINIVRLRPGIPSSLAAFCVNDYPHGSSPLLWGFPNYEVNALRASDFSDDKFDYYDEGKSHKKKPNKHHNNYYGQNSHHSNGGHNNNYYGNYHGNHHYIYQTPFYPKPTPTPMTTTTTTKKPHKSLRIISTYITDIDEKCNRAFTFDIGLLNYYGNDTRVIQKPALLVFDIPPDCCETREFPLIRRSVIPDHVAGSIPFGILFSTLDYQSSHCDDLFIYTSNPFTSHIIVYDFKNDEFWAFSGHPTFQPIIAESSFVFDKTFEYDMPLGVSAFALGYEDKYGDRTAYYIQPAGTGQYAVSTRVLKDRSKAPDNYNPDDFSIMGYRGCQSQASNIAVDYTYGVMFFLEMESNRVRCWNMNKPLNPDNLGVVYESPEKFIYGTQIFVDSRGYLWFNSNNLPVILLSDLPLNLRQVNSRIFRVKVSDAIRGTICDDEDSYRLADLYNGYGY